MNEAEFHPIKALGWNTKQKLIMKTRAEWLAVLEEQEGETSFEAGWIGSSTSESWSRESITQKLENSTSSRIRFTLEECRAPNWSWRRYNEMRLQACSSVLRKEIIPRTLLEALSIQSEHNRQLVALVNDVVSTAVQREDQFKLLIFEDGVGVIISKN